MSFQNDITGIPAPLPADYDRQYNFTDHEIANPADPKPGDKLDAEFNAIEKALDQTQSRLLLIQRDDGALANDSVGLDQMSQEALIGVNTPETWTTFTSYSTNASIFVLGKWYLALESHVSSGDFATDLAAGKWKLLLDLTTYTTEAKNWANTAEDVLVPEGDQVDDYSALHHAAKAAADRILAEAAKTASQTAQGLSESARNASQTAQGLSESARDASQTAESGATTQAGIATTKAGEASVDAAAVAALYDLFDDRFLGSKTSDPSLDNDGNALVEGAIYWKSTAPKGLKVYNGASWEAATASAVNVGISAAGNLSGTDVATQIGELDALMPRKNAILNSSFNLWQRGTSFTLSGVSLYTADRWRISSNGGTVSRKAFTLGQTDVPDEPRYYYEYAETAGTGTPTLQHRIESVRTFAGKTVTISFWAKVSSGSINISSVLTQNFGTGGSPSSDVNTTLTSSQALTTSWTKFTFTVTLPPISGKTIGSGENDYLAFAIGFPAATFTFHLAQVQVEESAVASPFEFMPEGLDLVRCKRFYEKSYSPSVTPGTSAYSGHISMLLPVAGTSDFSIHVRFEVEKRASPTVTVYNPDDGTAGQCFFNTTSDTGSMTIYQPGPTGFTGLTTNTTTSKRSMHFQYTAEAEL